MTGELTVCVVTERRRRWKRGRRSILWSQL